MISLRLSHPTPGGSTPLRSPASAASETEALGRLTTFLSLPQREELRAALSEGDPELRGEALMNFAARLEQRDQVVAAAEIYSALVGTGGPERLPLLPRAQSRLDAILGRGAFGARAEFLLRNLAQQAADPAALMAMGAAGAVFRLTRLGVLSRLTASASPGILTQLLGAGRIASAVGFAVEAPVFTLASRLGNAALGREPEWGAAVVGREVVSSYLVLGGMRLAGWASRAASRNLGGLREGPLQALFQQSGMLGGILLGHRLEEWAGLRERRDGATTLTDSLALLLQFNVAGRLTLHAFGPRFAAWERQLDAQAECMTAAPRRIPPPFGTGTGFGWAGAASPRPALAAAGERPESAFVPVLMMEGRGGRPAARRVAFSPEIRYWLAQVENQDPDVAVGAVARLEDLLRQRTDLNAKQYARLFLNLAAKTEANVHGDVIDVILTGLNEMLEGLDVKEPGPRALFQEMQRPAQREDALVSGFYASWLRNPTLERGDRERIVERVVEAFNSKYGTEVPHDAALDLIAGVRRVPHLETDLFVTLGIEASRFAADNVEWFNQFEPSLQFVRDMLADPRLPEFDHVQFVRVLVQGLRDADLRSARRVHILDHLEDLATSQETVPAVRAWLRGELPEIRETFLDDNLREIRKRPGTFSNYAEIGYLLTRDYVASELRAILSQEVVAQFRRSSPDSMGYDHIVDVALSHARNSAVPAESRFHLWSILFKAAADFEGVIPREIIFSRRDLHHFQRVEAALAQMPRAERVPFALRWIDRLSDPLPERRGFAMAVLNGMAPHLEPDAVLRGRLEMALRYPSIEVQATAHRLLSVFNQLN